MSTLDLDSEGIGSVSDRCIVGMLGSGCGEGNEELDWCCGGCNDDNNTIFFPSAASSSLSFPPDSDDFSRVTSGGSATSKWAKEAHAA